MFCRWSVSRARAIFVVTHVTPRRSIRLEEARWKRSQSISGGRSSRTRCKAETHLFHEQAAPCAACNRRSTHIGSLILPVGCLVAPSHRPGSSRKPCTPESACFVVVHAGPCVALAPATISRFTVAVEIGEGSQTVRFCAVATLRKRIAGEKRVERRVYPNFPIAWFSGLMSNWRFRVEGWARYLRHCKKLFAYRS